MSGRNCVGCGGRRQTRERGGNRASAEDNTRSHRHGDDLPGADARAAIRELLGSLDTIDQGVYHHRAVLHVHGNSCGLPQNAAVWALASAWRGTALYLLAGPVAITGRTSAGELTDLDGDLVRHARVVAQTVRETLTEWRRRPPISNEAAISELLAYEAHDNYASK